VSGAGQTPAPAGGAGPSRDDGRAAWGSGVLAPLRHRLFLVLYLFSAASTLGSWMQNAAAGWQMTDLTSRALLVSLVDVMTTIAMFLLVLPGGVLADLVSRRLVMIVCNVIACASSVVLGALSLAGFMTPDWLLMLLFVGATTRALMNPTWQGVLPQLVKKDELGPAVTLNALSVSITLALGPALAGVLLSVSGAWLVYFINAATFLGIGAALFFWKEPVHHSDLPAERLVVAVRNGLRFVRSSPGIVAVSARIAAFGFLAGALLSILPVYARTALKLGPTGFGLLTACVGLGGFATGTLLLPRLLKHVPQSLLANGGTLLLGAVLAVVGLTRSFPLACALFFVAGGARIVMIAVYKVSAQSVLPPWVRSRGIAVVLMASFAGFAAGGIVWGSLVDAVGVRSTYLIAAATSVVVVAATGWLKIPYGITDGANLAGEVPDYPVARIDEPEMRIGPVEARYRIKVPDALAAEALPLLEEHTRMHRRAGALYSVLWRDLTEPDQYVLAVGFDNWAERLRLKEHLSEADSALLRRTDELLGMDALVVLQDFAPARAEIHPRAPRPTSTPEQPPQAAVSAVSADQPQQAG